MVKEAGNNAASFLKSAGAKRQGAGVGAGCDAILTDGDTGSGLLVKEAGNNAASFLKSAGAKRQSKSAFVLTLDAVLIQSVVDKMGAGAAAVVGVVAPGEASYMEGLLDTVDGDGTNDSAIVGEQMGELEVQAGTGAGALVPSDSKAPLTGGGQGAGGGSTTAAAPAQGGGPAAGGPPAGGPKGGKP